MCCRWICVICARRVRISSTARKCFIITCRWTSNSTLFPKQVKQIFILLSHDVCLSHGFYCCRIVLVAFPCPSNLLVSNFSFYKNNFINFTHWIWIEYVGLWSELMLKCIEYCLCVIDVTDWSRFVQAKNGEGLPQGPHPHGAAQLAFKEQVSGEREEAESKALQAVQCSLLKILSKTLATLQHFTPDCCQILLDQVHKTPHYYLLHSDSSVESQGCNDQKCFKCVSVHGPCGVQNSLCVKFLDSGFWFWCGAVIWNAAGNY